MKSLTEEEEMYVKGVIILLFRMSLNVEFYLTFIWIFINNFKEYRYKDLDKKRALMKKHKKVFDRVFDYGLFD
ncbi:hypothetical protein [Candidatus Mycoplasma haematohominis]|uniref:Uncharacterized protein n=1 Tax=Candidatus Mycoplasma haematohominis TaxID=1494318 RepID=A0A478FSG8_9MOLU|nr:hypothetical protein [Candidatus Mycoplasma haemohominis]GCE64024.1 hypothetical protein MHSWG343_10320 [Candidatus Mycoplasma haemohominis]